MGAGAGRFLVVDAGSMDEAGGRSTVDLGCGYTDHEIAGIGMASRDEFGEDAYLASRKPVLQLRRAAGYFADGDKVGNGLKVASVMPAMPARIGHAGMDLAAV